MKTFENKNGFTLIELLAVIVVLAIVMVLATTTVLPLMSDTQVNAFILEANNARDAASNVMTLISIGNTNDLNLTAGDDYRVNTANTKYCFSLKKLVEAGLWKKNIESVTPKDGKTEYEGKVIVTTSAGATNNYTYRVVMHNSNYYIDHTGTAKSGDQVKFSTQTGFICKTTDVS